MIIIAETIYKTSYETQQFYKWNFAVYLGTPYPERYAYLYDAISEVVLIPEVNKIVRERLGSRYNEIVGTMEQFPEKYHKFADLRDLYLKTKVKEKEDKIMYEMDKLRKSILPVNLNMIRVFFHAINSTDLKHKIAPAEVILHAEEYRKQGITRQKVEDMYDQNQTGLQQDNNFGNFQ